MRLDCFVTATDTGVGKTWVSAGLMSAAAAAGMRVAGMKPVASGCRRTREGWRNDDALLLQSMASTPLDYALVNPVALPDAVAPHIAAARAGMPVDMETIMRAFDVLKRSHDAVIVEGIGGWRVPLRGDGTVADLARGLEIPVVLVVGLRLGCINHALLSAEAIIADRVPFAGWVANNPAPDYGEGAEVVNYLSERIAAPMLASIPYLPTLQSDRIAGSFAIDLLTSI